MHSRRNPEQQQKLKTYARELRSQQTDVESRLWHVLRDRRFFGHKFRRQHAVENSILDFYCPDQRLAIELDGGQHTDQQAYDEKRAQILAALGIRILRFWNNDVLQQTEAVLQVIFDALDALAAPHPQPLYPFGAPRSPWDGARGELQGPPASLPPSPPLGGPRCPEGVEGRGEGHSTQQRGAGGNAAALRAKALAYLASRDHTRQELARKLHHAGHAEEDIEPLLEELSQRGWLSDQRFAESYVQQKQQRFGTLKLAYELRSRGVDESDIQRALLESRDTELARAREVWSKRFGAPPANAQEKARQMRFLLGRGFPTDVVARVVSGLSS